MRLHDIAKITLLLGSIVVILSISCQKNGTNPVTVIKDSTVVKDSTVIIDSTVYIDSCITAASLKNGLLVYLQFNGNFADSSGNGNPTTSIGATLDYDEHGNANSAFSGNYSGGRVVVTNNGSIKFDTAFTYSIDIMLNTVSHEQDWGTFVNRADGSGPSWGVGMGIPGASTFNFTVSDSLETCSDFVSPSNSFTDTSVTLVPGAWYNIIATYTKGNMLIYINGKLTSVKTVSMLHVPSCPNGQLIVGGWWDGDPQSLDGKMDEVRLYDRSLTAKEIAALSKKFR